MSEWQDIASVPYDGRWVIICGPRLRPVQAHWNDAAEQWQRFNCLDKGLEPTLWQPLPESPL